MLSNARKSVAHAKDRSEVRGGGKKPWRQKGTGRARHGSNRSPIWVGGGVTHGPLKEKNYDKKINRKMKIKALFSALSAKLSNNKILFVEGFDIKDAKTKEAANFISKLSSIDGFNDIETKPKNSALFVAPKKAESLSRSFRNIPNVSFDLISNMNPVSLLQYKYVIFLNPKDSIEVLEEKIK